MVTITEGLLSYHDDYLMTLKWKFQEKTFTNITGMSKTYYQSYGNAITYILGMCPITWWYTVKGLPSSAGYSSNGKQIASISPHADPNAYEPVLKIQ